ncbi:hypothetical protein M404DRAFT_998993 [Pisolithus tinctorius Marx 270]|uniref:Uncharacterized protein n=1 Tax=Pisolithus tinctorius Marx 270 TaxID=870435 RepID=A0A0C3JBB9_PISTI|nr:hypothetical protein M404DRAFT_998993 [Pisolithus tinctorius Marx 270]
MCSTATLGAMSRSDFGKSKPCLGHAAKYPPSKRLQYCPGLQPWSALQTFSRMRTRQELPHLPLHTIPGKNLTWSQLIKLGLRPRHGRCTDSTRLCSSSLNLKNKVMHPSLHSIF